MSTTARPGPAEVLRRLRENLERVRGEIEAACRRSGRPPGSVELLAVVKHVGADRVRLLLEAGARELGEGTVQGAVEKVRALQGAPPLPERPRWHLVGHLQRNKARRAAELFDSIHSLDSERLARRLEEEMARREGEGLLSPTAPGIYLEVNIAEETAKTGIPPAEVPALLRVLESCPRVRARLCGLMAMAPHSEDPRAARGHFRRLREMRDRLAGGGLLPPGSGLSMGMSGDFPAAVEEGATVVRVGTALFEGIPPEDPGKAT